MDMYACSRPNFSRWIVQRGYLHEPFVLIDVGLGHIGVHPRWREFGDHLKVYGFDPVIEVVEALQHSCTNPDQYAFFPIAINDRDGECELSVPADSDSSSIYHSAGKGVVRTVESAKLDTLWSEGLITGSDFIKADCEGAELATLQGGREFLAASTLMGMEVETNFNVSKTYPLGHYQEISCELSRYNLLTVDMQMNRIPRRPFADRVLELAPADWASNSIGRLGTVNALFSQNPTDPALQLSTDTRLENFSTDKLLKLAMFLELYGLPDGAAEVLAANTEIIGERFDIDEGIDLLCRNALNMARVDSDMVKFWYRMGVPADSPYRSSSMFREFAFRLSHCDPTMVSNMQHIADALSPAED